MRRRSRQWAGRRPERPSGQPVGRAILRHVVDAATLALVALVLVLTLGAAGEEAAADSVRAYIIAEGTEETGAFNLVTSIYLGYRAYDTLGETVVLVIAVSGVAYLIRKRR